MAAHGISVYDVNLWRGGSPPLIYEQLVTHTRSGVDGVAVQKIGRFMEPTDSEIVMHLPSYNAGYNTLLQMHSLPDEGPVPVKYNNLLMSSFGLWYYCLSVKLNYLKAMPRLKGPGYDFIGGAELVVGVSLLATEQTPQP